MHRTDFFIVCGAELEYTLKKTFKNVWWMMLLYWSICIFICKFNVLHNPSSPGNHDRPHYSFRCNIESKHFTWKYSLIIFYYVWGFFQIYFQRILSQKTVANAKLASYLTAVFAIICSFPAMIVGAVAKSTGKPVLHKLSLVLISYLFLDPFSAGTLYVRIWRL